MKPKVVDDSDEWDVDRLLNSAQRYRKLHLLLQCEGYSYTWKSWEPAENLGNVQESVDEFHREHLTKPRR